MVRLATDMNNDEKLVEESKEEELQLLPLCEANRRIVTDPTIYAGNAVFNVGSMKLIQNAP
jgi:hypothetical protein